MTIRCPHCHDLFIPENGKIPDHYLDLFEGDTKCAGSGLETDE